MSFNRRRNIFTLGDYQTHQHPHQYAKTQLSRLRQNSDPFERDPFKIQSYNFHYADKPSYPLQNLVNRISSQTSVKRFETHFYNYDFATAGCNKENTAASSTATAATTANHNSNNNKFHEFRRRKFLHTHQQQVPAATQHMSPYGSSGQTLNNNRQRLGTSNGSNSSLRHQYQRQQQQQQQQYEQEQLQQQQQQQQQQLRQPSPHRHQQQHHAFCVPCSSNSVNANSSNMASIYAYAPPTTHTGHTPLLRTGCNREFLQGIRTVSSPNAPDAQHNFQQHCLQQQQHQQQRQQQQQHQSHDLQRSKSRSCLPLSQRFYSELGCRSSGTGIGGSGSNSTTALNSGTADKNLYGNGGTRASLSQHNNINSNNSVNKRKPLQTLSPKNLVTANVEQRQNSSGCHINININGLNAADHLGGENLTIKIESENRSVRNISASSNNLAERMTSPQKTDIFNIVPSNTNSQTFGIDKRLSKFAISNLREVSSDRSQSERDRKVAVAVLELEKAGAAATAAAAAAAATNDLKTLRAPATSKTESTKLDVRPSQTSQMRRRSKERMPSLVPWNIDDNLRSCFTKDNNPDIDLPQNRPTNLMRRIRTNYNSAFRDMKNLQKYADELAEAKRRRTDKKILNTSCTAAEVPSQQQGQRKLLQPRVLPNLTPPRHSASRHSMRSNDEFGNAMHLLKCGSSDLDRRQQSRLSLTNKLPWNVNINVYADKLKLLRV